MHTRRILCRVSGLVVRQLSHIFHNFEMTKALKGQLELQHYITLRRHDKRLPGLSVSPTFLQERSAPIWFPSYLTDVMGENACTTSFFER